MRSRPALGLQEHLKQATFSSILLLIVLFFFHLFVRIFHLFVVRTLVVPKTVP